ncbi:lung seven transmembrane receptor [Anaeramoeba flamelloides]|uniref:Lung seven transmembrane receptor n=1 Tax=Anaeramoeba flamelloides TaxID=1746091 RepID=A0AAV7YNK9_9EUKA|nr:lung seven transmembrane receptor [Anaeramoeba flamelloides]
MLCVSHFILIVLFFLFSHAAIEHYQIKTDVTLTTFDKFGFNKGGVMNLTIKYEPKNSKSLSINFCTPEEVNKEQTTFADKACKEHKWPCEWYKELEKGEYEINKVFKEEKFYYFILLHCESETIEYDIDSIFKNPGSYLSNSYFLIPKFTLLTLGFYITVLCLWIVNWVRYCSSIKLHKFLTALLISKILHLVVIYFYWTALSQSGKVPTYLLVLYFIVEFFTFYFLLAGVMYVSYGWSVILFQLTVKQNVYINVISIVLSVLIVIFNVQESLRIYNLSNIFLAINFVLFLYIYTRETMNRLNFTIRTIPADDNVMLLKKFLLMKFQRSVMSFICFSVLWFCIGSFVLGDQHYQYGYLIFKTIVFLFFCSLLYIFRLRKEYEKIDQEFESEDEEDMYEMDTIIIENPVENDIQIAFQTKQLDDNTD